MATQRLRLKFGTGRSGGVWSVPEKAKSGSALGGQLIIESSANDDVRPIHVKGRMPVVIHKYDYKRWQNPDTPFNELRQMIQPLPNEETHAAKFEGPEPAPKEKAAATSKQPKELKQQASLFDM